MITRMLIFNLIFIITFNVVADAYFYKYFVCRLTQNRKIRALHWIADAVIVAIIALLFVLVYVRGTIPHSVYQTFMYIYVLIYIPKAAYLLLSFPGAICKRCANVFWWIGTSIMIITFLAILYGGTIGRNTLRVEPVEISYRNLPVAFDGYKIAQISDVHIGNMPNDRLLKKTLKKLVEIKPDVIVFSGDLVHTRTSEADPYKDVLAKFADIAPVYTVMGNHDYGDYVKWDSKEAYRQNLRDMRTLCKDVNWTMLDNESRLIYRGGDSIAIMGVENWGEPPFPQYGNLFAAQDGVENVDFKVLISHNPNHWLRVIKDKANIQLTLSGHTHAMQMSITLFGKKYSPASLKYELWSGLYTDGQQYLYVNDGLGIALFPFRLGAIPELTIITLRR